MYTREKLYDKKGFKKRKMTDKALKRTSLDKKICTKGVLNYYLQNALNHLAYAKRKKNTPPG